jgi:tetratricopeptide (TPR) repeat protein
LTGFWIILASSIAAAPPPAQVAVAAPQAKAQSVAPGPATTSARLERAAAAIDDGRFADALSLTEGLANEAKIPADDIDWAAYLQARALVGLGRVEDGEIKVRERYRDNPNGYSWAALVAILVTRGQYDEAAAEILELKEETLIFANRLRPSVIDSIVAALEGKDAKLRDKVIVRLVEGRYAGPSRQRVPDLLRLRYIDLLLRERRVEDAARQTESLESPAILSMLLTDKSFEALWEHPKLRVLMAPGALVARVDRGVQAQLESQALSSSDWLDTMRALRAIGKSDEAVRLGLHALEQARKEKRPAGASLRLEIASAYADLGQTWAARRTARELLREEASAPISLRIAIADVLEASGDDEGAMLLVSAMPPSPGALKTIVCAAHDLDRAERRDAALTALAALAETAPAEMFAAYVCAGEQAKAAEILGSMFQRPDLRTSAILTAQLYSDLARPGSDLDDMRYRMKALVATASVQDAIKPYARTMALPFTIANARVN